MVSIAKKLQDTATGELDDHKRLRDVVSALERGIATLTERRKNQALLPPEEKSMLQVAEQCQDIGKQIFHLLDRYQTGPRSQFDHEPPLSAKRIAGRLSTKKTIKVTLRILWDKPEAEGLRKAFEICTSQLSIHLMLVSRSDILKEIDVVFAKYCEKSLTDIESILNTLEATFGNLSKKSDHIIKQTKSMTSKLDQVVDNQLRGIDHIIELQKRFEASHPAVDDSRCRQILEAIAFQDIRMRSHEIGKVELAEQTFEWMVKDEMVPPTHQHLKQPFRNWLEKGEGIFHITGKPGSGKSTMMNFLANHPETRSQLNKWARNGNSIVMASVFLWDLGSAEQKNMDGMYRTLLHTILSKHRELIPQIFGDHWNTLSEELSMSQPPLEINRNEIKTALEELITDSTRGYQYCFFIDGLDEFNDDNMPNYSLASQLDRWVDHQGIKICVSSREHAPWTPYFAKFPRLRIHLTTEQDIRRMIDKYLFDDRHLKTFDPTESEKFVSRFVHKADGVFIWVKLVLHELEAELNSEVSLDALYQVLDTFPKKLETFYDRILRKVDKPEAWAVLDVLVETAKWDFRSLFTICHHSLLSGLTSNPDAYQGTSGDTPWREDPTAETQALVDNFRKRVPLLFRGMVDVIPGGNFRDNPALDWLTFSHRSIYEYLSTIQRRERLRSRVDTQIMIVKCLIEHVNRYRVSSVDLSLVLGNLLSQIQHTHNDSILQVLGLLDETLLYRHIEAFKDLFLDFHSSPNYIPRGKEQIPMVFFQSCEQGFLPYLRWTIRNSPFWRNNEWFRATAIAILSSTGDAIYHQSTAESLQILLSDGYGPNFWYAHPSFSLPISPWTRFLFYFIAKSAIKFLAYNPMWPVVRTFIENNADLDLVFRWTIQKTSGPPRRFYVNDVKVERRASLGSQHSETDTFFFKRKKFLVSRDFSYKFPRGGSVREVLVHFVPTDLLPFVDNLNRSPGAPIVE
ncbi:P-loop containing protein [Fusarium circinatum]|uniref:P-loop containing protein n=1 Tax=Fusarium circinatum TaxID=48490 RepID=A0A8H5SMV4_FUSCI|nr:P-loop containing protein [Fusarium circinatum]